MPMRAKRHKLHGSCDWEVPTLRLAIRAAVGHVPKLAKHDVDGAAQRGALGSSLHPKVFSDRDLGRAARDAGRLRGGSQVPSMLAIHTRAATNP